MKTNLFQTQNRTFWEGQFISSLRENEIFVFGSNPQGRHGAGSARFARDHFGAKNGIGRGFTGQCYALPTTSLAKGVVDPDFPEIVYDYVGGIPKAQIIDEIILLYKTAEQHSEKNFLIGYTYDYLNKDEPNIYETKKGLSGYDSYEILSLFLEAKKLHGTIPDNIIFSSTYILPLEELATLRHYVANAQS